VSAVSHNIPFWKAVALRTYRFCATDRMTEKGKESSSDAGTRRWIWTTSGSRDAPAGLRGELLVKVDIVGTLRRLAHQLVNYVSVRANQDAPLVGLDPV